MNEKAEEKKETTEKTEKITQKTAELIRTALKDFESDCFARLDELDERLNSFLETNTTASSGHISPRSSASSFDKNNILSIDMSNWLYFSEFLARHNITKLTDIEHSSLIDVEHKERGYSPSFEALSNIEQKVLITFIEEFDRVYNSIGSK